MVKTGFRFVVAWESPQAGTGTLRVLVGDGAWENHTDPLSRRVHVFLIQFLPVGGVLCFQAFDATAGGTVSSHVHAVRLANAMNAYDPYAGTYSINLVTSANHLSNRAILEAGYRHFAEALWDATDGRVRAGHLIVLYNDFERPYVIVTGLGLAPARIWHDVIFQHDFPLYAGYTRRDGIADADEGFIVMNSLWEAPAYATSPTPALVHEVGHILLHELGHYAFGALDLYTDVDDCFEAATTISVMGGNLQATEFDDELRRCPNAASISGYVPTWTLLRERFPAVGARDGAIDPGPEGDGGAFQFRAYDVAAR